MKELSHCLHLIVSHFRLSRPCSEKAFKRSDFHFFLFLFLFFYSNFYFYFFFFKWFCINCIILFNLFARDSSMLSSTTGQGPTPLKGTNTKGQGPRTKFVRHPGDVKKIR